MKNYKKSFYSFLTIGIFLFNVSTTWGQPPFQVNAPKSYANPVVIVIPDGNLYGGNDKVTIYVVGNNTGVCQKIVRGDSLINYKKYKAKMHVRGDATALDPKKQYAVKVE